MIGIDLTKISRFENKSKSFIVKILTSDELVEYGKQTNKAKFLATRWAIKEALFKVNNKYFQFNDINILKQGGYYVYKDYQISTSCEGDFVISIVIKEKNEVKNSIKNPPN